MENDEYGYNYYDEEEENEETQIDQYQKIKTLGCGSFGSVYLVQDPKGNKFALKAFIKEEQKDKEKSLADLQNEVEILQKLKHENIIRYIDYKENAIEEYPNGKKVPIDYIIMELANCGTLFESELDEPFSEEICRFFFKKILSGLHCSHSNEIIHRDLKGENILLGTNQNIKIADFCLASLVLSQFLKLAEPKISGLLKSIYCKPKRMKPVVIKENLLTFSHSA